MIYEEVIELAKRRGFFWPSFSVYGGTRGFYDYGPLGVLMRDNIVRVWKEEYMREGAVFIDTPVLAPQPVFKASGHIDRFSDLAVECPSCRSKFKLESVLKRNGIGKVPLNVEEANGVLTSVEVKCPECGARLREAYDFNLMFPVQGKEETLYLRPETAQGIFVNFRLLNNVARNRLPMAAAQLGKGFRNEISPRQGLIRMREFTQGEVEVFLDPERKEWKEIPDYEEILFVPNTGRPVRATPRDAFETGIVKNKALAYFILKTHRILTSVGIEKGKIRFRQHEKEELAHYASDSWDAEANLDDEWIEVVGIADRGTYDLSRHQQFSGQPLTVTVDGREILPCVVEPSYGIDRIFMAVLMTSLYTRSNGFRVLRLPPHVAPYHAAVFPLQKKGLEERSRQLFESLQAKDPYIYYDESGSIGKRYARQDEIGTPFCITVDYQTLEDDSVTVRFRDTAEQVRVQAKDLLESSDLLSFLEGLWKSREAV